MPILIDKVRIYNYRSLHKVEIDLSPVTLLIGANNSGKTSFLRALNLALGIGPKRIATDDFFIKKNEVTKTEQEILIDIRIIPVDKNNARAKNFDDDWREKQFGVLISIDANDNEFFAFRTKVTFDIIKGEYIINRYKIKEWKEESDWVQQKHPEELKQSFNAFPLFFIDAQRDIIQDLRDRNSYFGKLISNIKIKDELVKKIEEAIQAINEDIVTNSDELELLKQELKRLGNTISSCDAIEISPVNKKVRDINRGININLQDSDSESFPLDYHGMGTRSWASLLTFGAFISWQYRKSSQSNTPYHTILALEEPESHLHPHAQRTLYKQLSEMNGQKVISSHSPFIASQCELQGLRHFKKSDGFTKISKIVIDGLTEEEKRKLHREVLNSRGELFFSRGVVLFEGETEEQSLPIFANKYWGKHVYELGLSFVGVGGNGNYTPFLRMLRSFDIPWYIFSDGEEKSIKNVNNSLGITEYGDIATMSNIKVIPGHQNIEEYLLNAGYKEEILKAIMAFKEDNNEIKNESHKQAKLQELKKMSDKEIIELMLNNKTKMSPYYANEIATLPDKDRSIPEIINDLFDKMKDDLFKERR